MSEAIEQTSTMTIAQAAKGDLIASALTLEVLEGPDVGLRVEIAGGRALIGSHKEAHLELTDQTVSRRHAELRSTPQGILLIDLSSKNGTRVEGVLVKEALLTSGGRFQTGATVIQVHLDSSPLNLEVADKDGVERFGNYLTENPPLKKSLLLLRRIALSEATVLIEGETGTGKELLARAIHDHSPRSEGPYVIVDCSAVTTTLLESQLFGHKRGAFTGAVDDHVGAFEAADAGTVFLDELGELPLDLQPKLLRAIESRTIRRVGDVADRPIDVRFVAATNRDLEQMSKEGTFRSDLYYRVAVVRTRIPPLRSRREDVALLAAHYAKVLSEGRATLAPQTFSALSHYDWPGNARELRNVLQRAIAICDRDEILPSDIFPGERDEAPQSFHEAKDQLIASFERRYVKALLERHDGNVSRAAKDAGLSRNALYALMRRAGLTED